MRASIGYRLCAGVDTSTAVPMGCAVLSKDGSTSKASSLFSSKKKSPEIDHDFRALFMKIDV
ncbi:hypothetical protein [Rhizobium lusitanum]|uniref:hypothetical protein n=1 Tax=Rhizobium lusitanum TaxID=293958 RepID=UPI001959BCA8|nr:hypothetical protein [Rhizobium lusitanum]MBM7047612.1 hypothetical protein [Rhizobium lusitanum]